MSVKQPSWKSLQHAADLQQKSADHTKAIELYTQALAQPGIPWEAVVNMTLAAASSLKMLGRFMLADAYLTGLAKKAAERGDDVTIVRAYAELLFILRRSGGLKRGLQLAQDALEAAVRTSQPGLKADILLPLVAIQAELGETQIAQAFLVEAKSLIQPEELLRLVKACYVEGILLTSTGQYQDQPSNAEAGLAYARRLGDRDWEGHAWNAMAISCTDMALRHSYWEKATAAFEDADDRVMQAVVISNSCDTLNEVGLYQRAWEMAERALGMSRETEQISLMAYCYQNLGASAEGMGDLPAAVNFWQQAITYAQKTGMAQIEHILQAYLGNSHMLEGQLEQAKKDYQAAERLPYKHNPATHAYFLAQQAGVNTLSGDRKTARANALQALKLLDEIVEVVTGDISVAVVCWWCYRALRPAGKALDSAQKISKAAWHALEMGMRGLLIPIESLSDAGLKRGYLHRSVYRRLLIREWLKHAPAHNVSSEQIAMFIAQIQKPGRLDEVFTRLLKVGVRLNAERDPSRLPQAIVDEINELTGAERIALILFDEKGQRNLVKTLLPQPPCQAITGTVEAPPDQDAFLNEVEPWLAETAVTRQGFVRWLNPEGSLTEGRSLLVTPLVSHDTLLGLIYCDLNGCFGRFEGEDLDLLSVLANQSAVAVENAAWAATLEQKVADRTAELLASNLSLEQRNHELSIINKIQKGLAAELDFQAIIDLVGDKLSEVLHTDNLGIRWYDDKSNLVYYLYEKEHGQRLTIPPITPAATGVFLKVAQTRQPMVLNTASEMTALGISVLPGTDQSKSLVEIPIISGDRFLGVIHDENFEREYAYGEAELRLLTTIAATLGSALENARLFDETQRLFRAEQERVAELQLINAIQQGLAAELDFQAIVDLVGDKLRGVFRMTDISSGWYNRSENLTYYLYSCEHGVQIEIPPTPPMPGGSFEKITQTRQPLVWNTMAEGDAIAPVIPGTDASQSGVRVPIISSDRVIGMITMEDYEREHAFGEAEIRLLTTIAATLGSALENARLFDETQRLLAETEQRNSELAIINSVQAALAAELNIQGIYDAVGDKIREIFRSDNLEIRMFDPNTNLEQFPYLYENGQRIEVEPLPRIETGFSAHVAHTRQILVVNEKMEEITRKVGSYTVPGTNTAKSAIFVPLIVGDQVRGLVCLSDFEREHAFSDSNVRLLQTLVNSMSVALENARLFNETQRLLEETSQRASELEVINGISKSMSSQLQVEAIVRTVGDQVRDAFHSEVVNIYLYEPATNLIHLPYSYDRQYVVTEPFQYGSGLTSKVIGTKQPLILGSFEEITGGGALLSPNAPEDDLMPQSYLGVPIIVGDKAIGAIDVQSYTQFVYDESHVRLLSTLASSMGVALENARLFEETRRLLAETEQRNRELAIISRVGQALVGQLDMQSIYDMVGEELRQIFDAQTVTILICDRQTGLLNWRYVLDEGQRVTVSPRPPSGFGGHILRTRKPLLITHDLDKRAAELGSILVVGQRPKSYLGVPLMAGGEVTGVITLQNVDREYAYNEIDLRLLSTLALNMGVALENARLYQETQRHAVEMAALAEIGSDIASTHEMEPVLERLATKTRELLDVRDIALWLIQPDGNTMRSVVALGKYTEETKAAEITLGKGITGSVAQSGEAEIVNLPEQDSRTMHIPGTPQPEEEPECMMLAPLISRGQTIGVMTVYRDRSQGQFTQLELDFLVSLARQAAIAIESARLYTETESRASQMAALAEVGREISATLELPAVLERVTKQACDLLVAGTSAVYQLQPDGVTLKAIAAQGDVAAEVLADDSQLGIGIIGNIVKNGQAEWVNNTAIDPRGIHIAGTREIDQGEKLLVAPLHGQGKAMGALAVWRDPEDPPFNQAELNFAVGLAQAVAVAIENARLFTEVHRQKEYSETLVHNSPVAIVTTDKNYIVQSWNQAAERLFGYSREETIGKNLDNLVAYRPDTKAEAVSLNERTRTGGIIQCVAKRCRKDGSLVDVQLSGVPVVVDGEQTGVIAIYHDLTELKRAEEAILESQRRMADIINFLPDATLVIDREGKVIAWNHAIEEMTGVRAEDILGKGDYEYAIPFYGDRRPILIDMVFFPEEELDKNYTHIQRHDGLLVGEAIATVRGKMTYLNATASALKNSLGEAVGAIESIRDITEQKYAEQELQQAKSAAETANQAKSAFLAMMSHEIRTPMNAIIGMSGLLMDTPLSPDQHDFAETIRSSGDALLTIINDILDFSKIEAGKMSLEEQPFDLRDCLESALDLMKVRASEKDLELAYQLEPGVPAALVGDVTRLRQVLINLLGNAVKFTEQGEIVLTVSKGEGADSLHFSVRDTGIGIPPDRIDRLFQPFTQADTSTSRRYGGTGLGLALSKRLVEMMRGTMWVESEGIPGKGSIFHFTMTAPPALDWTGKSKLEGEQAMLRGKRILLVDDNPTNRHILELQVQTWGIQTHATSSPAEALHLLQRGDVFDLAILDLQMPEMDGIELAGEIRKLESSERLPLVLLSSLGGREAVRESTEFAAVLSKPIRQSALFDTLMNILGQAPQPAARVDKERLILDPEMAARHPLRILLAEDNVVNQKLALRLLSQMGYRADLAANGLEVMQAVKRQPYDVILMDVQMPEMDGLEATRQLCAQIPTPQRPRIVAMTANAMQGDREMCLEAGMDDYLSKPIRVDQLVQALSRCQPVGDAQR